ncbi:MAG: zf-HC2 domain-containing protein [Candidatus Rokubacteria bacterium]|nr:zf-HC2 domain-containing protein [Candidatus Rokubacteria bacterium]
MGCRDIVELLDDYLDGRLADEDARALEGHLRGCQDCTAFLETYRGTLRVTRALRERELPAQLRGRLLAFLRR